MVVGIIWVSLLALVINLPMGYWREGVRKFSPQWFVAVHAAVPVIAVSRRLLGIGYAWYTFPPLVLCYFGGQFIGARIRRRRKALAEG